MYGGLLVKDGKIEELSSLVRIGIISSVNEEELAATVQFVQQGIMSGYMKLLQNIPKECKKSDECQWCNKENEIGNWIPEEGQYVLCLMIPGGDGDGYILGEV